MQATINAVCYGIFINSRGNRLSDNRIAKNSIVQVISHIVSLQSLIIDLCSKAFGLADFVITFSRNIFDTGYKINFSIFQRKNLGIIIRDALNRKAIYFRCFTPIVGIAYKIPCLAIIVPFVHIWAGSIGGCPKSIFSG